MTPRAMTACSGTPARPHSTATAGQTSSSACISVCCWVPQIRPMSLISAANDRVAASGFGMIAYIGLSPVLLWMSIAASSGCSVTIARTCFAHSRIRVVAGSMPQTRLKSSWSSR